MVASTSRLALIAAVAALGACALTAAAPVDDAAPPPEIAAIDQALTAARLADWARRVAGAAGRSVR